MNMYPKIHSAIVSGLVAVIITSEMVIDKIDKKEPDAPAESFHYNPVFNSIATAGLTATTIVSGDMLF